MSQRLKWALITGSVIVIIAITAGFILVGKDNNATSRVYTEDDYNRDVKTVTDALLPELDHEIGVFKAANLGISQELAELAILRMIGKYQTANIELQAIQPPDGKISDHKKLLEIIHSGESRCGELAEEYRNGNFDADPEPCLNAFKELRRFSEK